MTQLTYRGFPCCKCQAEWLAAFEQELAELELPPLRLTQLIGDAPASAGRHLGGGNIDWWNIDVKTARLSRENGGLAMIRDGSRDSFDDNKHTHVYLPGCPHMSEGAKSDLAEVLRGGDGLIGDVADDPRLAGAWRPNDNWQKGVRRMRARQLERARVVTVGTHNTLDGAARESGFADILFFTEAVPKEIRVALEKTHRVWACPKQKDLVIAVAKRLNPRVVDNTYKLSNLGIKLVTPKRGTWCLVLDLLGVTTALIIDHRINAAFEPFIRGERFIRTRFWVRHTRITKALIRESKSKGHAIFYGGDPNTPRNISAVGNTLRCEVGEGKDRLASNRELVDVEELSKAGSDHHRLRATAQL